MGHVNQSNQQAWINAKEKFPGIVQLRGQCQDESNFEKQGKHF